MLAQKKMRQVSCCDRVRCSSFQDCLWAELVLGTRLACTPPRCFGHVQVEQTEDTLCRIHQLTWGILRNAGVCGGEKEIWRGSDSANGGKLINKIQNEQLFTGLSMSPHTSGWILTVSVPALAPLIVSKLWFNRAQKNVVGLVCFCAPI